MTPAERKFSDVEGGLMRAQCLVRVLRHATDCGLPTVDAIHWGGVYTIVCEAETAFNAAAELWNEAHAKIDRPT